MDEYNGHKFVGHGGANRGFRSVFMRFVNDNLSIIVLTNTEEAKPTDIAKTLADYYFRK